MISTINEILDLFRFLDLVQVMKSSIWSGSWTWSRIWRKDLVEDLVQDLVQVLDLDRILTKSSVGQANGPDKRAGGRARRASGRASRADANAAGQNPHRKKQRGQTKDIDLEIRGRASRGLYSFPEPIVNLGTHREPGNPA